MTFSAYPFVYSYGLGGYSDHGLFSESHVGSSVMNLYQGIYVS